jgi:hypothetical protein
VIHEDAPPPAWQPPGVAVTALPVPGREAELDLIVGFVHTAGRLHATLRHDREVFGEAGMRSLAQEIRAVLGALLADPAAPLDTLREAARSARRGAQARDAQERATRLDAVRAGLHRPRRRDTATP